MPDLRYSALLLLAIMRAASYYDLGTMKTISFFLSLNMNLKRISSMI